MKENVVIDDGSIVDVGVMLVDKSPLNREEIIIPINFIKRKIKPVLRLPFRLGRIFIETGEDILK